MKLQFLRGKPSINGPCSIAMIVYQRVSSLSEMTRSRPSFAVWWSGARRARPMWSVYPNENAGHNPKREESGGHMVAVLVVLVTKNMQKCRSGAGFHLLDDSKVFGNPATQGIPWEYQGWNWSNLLKIIRMKQDQIAKEFEASALPCAETMSALAFMFFYWNMLKH